MSPGWKTEYDINSPGLRYVHTAPAPANTKYYTEDEANDLIQQLVRADLVVGFNHISFDYEVLMGHSIFDFRDQLRDLDLLVDLEKQLGHRLKLEAVAAASIAPDSRKIWVAPGMMARSLGAASRSNSNVPMPARFSVSLEHPPGRRPRTGRCERYPTSARQGWRTVNHWSQNQVHFKHDESGFAATGINRDVDEILARNSTLTMADALPAPKKFGTGRPDHQTECGSLLIDPFSCRNLRTEPENRATMICSSRAAPSCT
ncbi:MAG: hypothetical protein HC900_09615 [Methylacidiphilales bacterium]|nr:hypothetical protein [Candidatus Methylacidiphilales bacterium]